MRQDDDLVGRIERLEAGQQLIQAGQQLRHMVLRYMLIQQGLPIPAWFPDP